MKRKLSTPDLTQFITGNRGRCCPFVRLQQPSSVGCETLTLPARSDITPVLQSERTPPWDGTTQVRYCGTGRSQKAKLIGGSNWLSPQALIQWGWSQTRAWCRHRMGRMTTLTQKQITCSAHALKWDPPSSFPVFFYTCRLRATVVIMAVSVPVMVWENARDLFLS